MKFPPACPEIPVRDLAPALAYYREILGFTIDWSDEDLGLAGLSRGASRIFMSSAAFRKALGNNAPIVLWINLEGRREVDELHSIWSTAGAEIAFPPTARAWKLYEFLTRDPDGNCLRVFYDFGWEKRGDG